MRVRRAQNFSKCQIILFYIFNIKIFLNIFSIFHTFSIFLHIFNLSLTLCRRKARNFSMSQGLDIERKPGTFSSLRDIFLNTTSSGGGGRGWDSRIFELKVGFRVCKRHETCRKQVSIRIMFHSNSNLSELQVYPSRMQRISLLEIRSQSGYFFIYESLNKFSTHSD